MDTSALAATRMAIATAHVGSDISGAMGQAFVSIGAGVAGLGTAAYLAYANKPAWALAAALAGLAPAAYYRLARPSAGVAINPSAPKPAA